MSRIIIVAAIEIELAPFIEKVDLIPDTWHPIGNHQVWLSFTGIGPVCAAYNIQRLIGELDPDLILQAGICGYYENCGLQVGQTVQVVGDRLADLGVMLDSKYSDIFPENKQLKNPHRFDGVDYPKVSGFTLNTGASPLIGDIRQLFENDRASIETMESYSLFYVCLQRGTPFLELRAVSNKVADERSSWNIPLSTKNLAAALLETLGKL